MYICVSSTAVHGLRLIVIRGAMTSDMSKEIVRGFVRGFLIECRAIDMWIAQHPMTSDMSKEIGMEWLRLVGSLKL